MPEVERYWLDIVGLTSTHSVGSGNKLLDKGWSLAYSGVAQGGRRQAGVGILTNPRPTPTKLEFVPVDEKVVSMRLKVAGRKTLDCCLYLCTEQQFRVFGLLGANGWGYGKGPTDGLHSPTWRLQRSRWR